MKWPHGIILILFVTTLAKANVVFEGYYRIETNGQHVGFAIAKRQIDPKTKTEILKYFLRITDINRVSHQVRLTEKYDGKLRPLEYRIEEIVGDKTTSSHVVVNSGKYKFTYQTKGLKPETKTGQMPPGAFFSAEIGLALAAAKPVVTRFYKYSAIQESTGVIADGQVSILDSKKVGKHRVYRAFDDFYVPSEEIWFLETGETLAMGAPGSNVTAMLVGSADEAIDKPDFDRSQLATFFGEIPKGDKNALVKKEVFFGKTLFKEKVKTKYYRVPGSTPLVVPK